MLGILLTLQHETYKDISSITKKKKKNHSKMHLIGC